MTIVVPEFRAFFDRRPQSILGKFSIRAKNGDYVVEKLLARSGTVGYEKTSWTRSRSPIPYGNFNLSTTPNNRDQIAGARGIGEAFPIDNQGDRYSIIDPKNRRNKRTEIMLHEENGIPGSEGCIVIVYHVEWLRVRDFLRELTLPSIPLEVL